MLAQSKQMGGQWIPVFFLPIFTSQFFNDEPNMMAGNHKEARKKFGHHVRSICPLKTINNFR